MRRRSVGLFRRGRFWYWKYKSPEGEWRERATRCTNYHEALKQRDVFVDELKKGTVPNDKSRWTLASSVSAWLAGRTVRVARGTFLSERTITRNLVRSLGADTPVHKLADIHCIHSYETARLSQGINPKTVNNELQVLAAILRDANIWHRVAAGYKPRLTDFS